jgi:hypothetical protein
MDFFFEVKKVKGDFFGRERLPAFADRKRVGNTAPRASRSKKDCRFGAKCNRKATCAFQHPPGSGSPVVASVAVAATSVPTSKMAQISALLASLVALTS